MGDRQDRDVRRKWVLWLAAGVVAGAAISVRRRWLPTNDGKRLHTRENPVVESREYEVEPRLVFEAVRHAVRHMARWKVVREDLTHMRLDAEVGSFLFLFANDVTVWVDEAARGSRVSIRSRSRLGRSYPGANSRSVKALQRNLEEEVKAFNEPGEAGHPDPGAEVLPAAKGAGPLLQRDYTGVIVGSLWRPERVVHMVRADIERFSAPELAAFIRPPRDGDALEIGDPVEVHIRGAGETHVRAVHLDDRSLTLRTMDDHVEAGRITFGCWRDDDGNLVFRIRSRARQAGALWMIGFLLGGKYLQAKIWETFIERVAEAAGGRLKDGVEVKTHEVTDTAADEGIVDTPTFAVPRT